MLHRKEKFHLYLKKKVLICKNICYELRCQKCIYVVGMHFYILYI